MRQAVALGLGWLIASPALATTLISMSIEELAQSADTIVIGTVKGSQTRMSGDGARVITDTEIRVRETLKGAPGTVITAMQFGGEFGTIGQRVAGTARFLSGEEVLVFLEKRGDRFRLVGMAQGKFNLEKSSDGTSVFVVPVGDGEALLVDKVTHTAVTARQGPLPLDVFKARVASALTPAAKPPAVPVVPVVPTAPGKGTR